MQELTGRQRQVLEFITSHIENIGYPPSQREIAAHLQISGTLPVAKHLTALEKKGYITRTTTEDDQRAKQIVMTEKGLQLVQKSITEILAVDERLFPDDRDNAELIRLLKKHF